MRVEIYNGDTFMVPDCGPDENGEIMKDIPTIRFDEYAMAFLMQHGNLAVPGGRYGSDTKDCAPIAIALSKIMQYHNGESITYYQLNSDMGLVVNSHDDVAYMIREYAATIGLEPADYLAGEDLKGCEACDGSRSGDPDFCESCLSDMKSKREENN